MDKSLEPAQKIYSVLNPYLGITATKVTRGFPSVIFIDFGNLAKNQRGYIWGEYRLAFQDTWRIVRGDTMLATSNDEPAQIVTALRNIIDQKLTSVQVFDNQLNTQFEFTGNTKIISFNVHSHFSDEVDLTAWYFHFPPKQLLSVGPGINVSVKTKVPSKFKGAAA